MLTPDPNLRRVPVEDQMWLIAALKDALEGGPALQPLRSVDDPEPGELPDGTAVVIHTSGSSGTPKFVAHTADSIRASAEATNEILGGPGQWIVTLPTHLIAGLQMLSRSIIGGTDPVFLTGKFTTKKFIAISNELEGERQYVSLVPVQLQRLMDAAETNTHALNTLQRFDAILVGGQALSLTARSRAHKLGLNVVRTYGMTETCGGVVYDGVEIGETQMRIRNTEVQLAGPSLALGYVGDDALTEASFIEDAGVRWYLTGDTGSLLGGMLQISGRLDRVITSGGVNVSLDEVERVALNLDGVEHVAAVAVHDTEWGERVALAVVSNHTAVSSEAYVATLSEALSRMITDELGAAAKPARIVNLDQLPRLVSGKPDYQSITLLLAKELK